MSEPTEAEIEAVARALFEEEWRPTKSMPKFENDFPDYWRRSARAAIRAIDQFRGIVEVEVLGGTK